MLLFPHYHHSCMLYFMLKKRKINHTRKKNRKEHITFLFRLRKSLRWVFCLFFGKQAHVHELWNIGKNQFHDSYSKISNMKWCNLSYSHFSLFGGIVLIIDVVYLVNHLRCNFQDPAAFNQISLHIKNFKITKNSLWITLAK